MSLLLIGTGGASRISDPFPLDIIFDQFTDANGSSIDAHVPDKDAIGGGWSEAAGTNWAINSNKLAGTGAGGDIVIIDSGQANIYVQATLNGDGNNGPGLVFRYISATDNWLSQLNFVSDEIQLYENTGSYQLRKSVDTGAISNTTDYVLRISVGDDDIFHMLLDGDEKGTHEASANNAATIVGIRGDSMIYNDFSCRAV